MQGIFVANTLEDAKRFSTDISNIKGIKDVMIVEDSPGYKILVEAEHYASIVIAGIMMAIFHKTIKYLGEDAIKYLNQ